jgi:hypothetical protein
MSFMKMLSDLNVCTTACGFNPLVLYKYGEIPDARRAVRYIEGL